jgi:trigger factor
VLEAVAEAEGLEASDAEVETEIERQARRLGRDAGEVREALAGSRAEVMRGDILRSKALALMVEQADPTGAPERAEPAPSPGGADATSVPESPEPPAGNQVED